MKQATFAAPTAPGPLFMRLNSAASSSAAAPGLRQYAIRRVGAALCRLAILLTISVSAGCVGSPVTAGATDPTAGADASGTPPGDESRAPAEPTATVVPSQVWGYVPDFDRPAAWSAAQASITALSGLSLFQYHLDGRGDLVEYSDLGGIPRWVEEQRLSVVPMITNHVGNRWDRETVAAVLTDGSRRRYHVDQIVRLAVDGDYPGVELDYENLQASDREPFSQFLQELAAGLHNRGKQVSVAVHAKLTEPGDWEGPRAQDWSRIGELADRVVVMTYDYDPSRPGPIAPLDWTRGVLRFAKSRMSAAKIIQGVPLYGYDWAENRTATDRTHREIMATAQRHGATPRRDEASRHLTFDYVEGGVRHQVWLADGDTVAALLAIGREEGIAGFALWRLGGEDPAVWGAVRGVMARS